MASCEKVTIYLDLFVGKQFVTKLGKFVCEKSWPLDTFKETLTQNALLAAQAHLGKSTVKLNQLFLSKVSDLEAPVDYATLREGQSPRVAVQISQTSPPNEPASKPFKQRKGEASGLNQYQYVQMMSHQQSVQGPRRQIDATEVSKHRSPDDCWVILNGIVYDLTSYLKFHPGGDAILLEHAGEDVTALFYKYHPWVNGQMILKNNEVGVVKQPKPAVNSKMEPLYP